MGWVLNFVLGKGDSRLAVILDYAEYLCIIDSNHTNESVTFGIKESVLFYWDISHSL